MLPMLTCVAAGLALAFTPVLAWRVKSGTWVCLQQPETFYYLQIAAQTYYNHPGVIRDPVVPGGVTFYPWLLYVPAVDVVRILGLSIFSVALIWSLVAGVGIGVSLYLLFWRFLHRPWIASGLTILCMSDFGFCGPYVILTQLRRLGSALVVHPAGELLLWPYLQWRAPDPALNLPFLFVQIVALSIARERPRRLNLWISGAAFGVLFYVFFYLWTMAAAALFIAFILDRAGRKVYLWTLLIGGAIGLPQLLLNLHLRKMASAEAITRLGLFVHASRTHLLDYPILSVAIVIVAGLWIWRTGRFELIYLLSLVIAGILLGYGRLITGITFHEYHYNWHWWPIRMILLLIVIAIVAGPRIPRRSKWGIAFAAFAMLYLVSAIYLNAIDITRDRGSRQQIQDFVRYRAQRLGPGSRSDGPAIDGRRI